MCVRVRVRVWGVCVCVFACVCVSARTRERETEAGEREREEVARLDTGSNRTRDRGNGGHSRPGDRIPNPERALPPLTFSRWCTCFIVVVDGAALSSVEFRELALRPVIFARRALWCPCTRAISRSRMPLLAGRGEGKRAVCGGASAGGRGGRLVKESRHWHWALALGHVTCEGVSAQSKYTRPSTHAQPTDSVGANEFPVHRAVPRPVRLEGSRCCRFTDTAGATTDTDKARLP